MQVSKIGIIGAGQMGTGIAEVCAASGFEVTLFDIDRARVEQSVSNIGESLQHLADKGRLDESVVASALQRVTPVFDYGGFSDCQLVIEAAVEDEDVKKDILRSVCQVLAPDAVVTSNTSTISITRLGAQTDRPGRFIGTHFMNPVPKIGLVELIRGIATEEQTYRIVHDFVLQLGKTPVSAEDFPAFIVHRILMPMINEAIYTLYEGVGSVESIDVAMRLGTRHPMGPLELADFIGLDTCLGIMQTLHDGLADSKYRPCPLLVKYVEAGWLGLKAKRGFYDYSGEQPIPTR
ncbi:MAG: 3-hydroxybutyryl-CoA dehydrogenase [Hyphomicrobiales bacterium]|nr:3-hydroxybutyryl-CoA dehydrogenase [Hyphomicrobiales bacterium]